MNILHKDVRKMIYNYIHRDCMIIIHKQLLTLTKGILCQTNNNRYYVTYIRIGEHWSVGGTQDKWLLAHKYH